MADQGAVNAIVQELIRNGITPLQAPAQAENIARALDSGMTGPEIVQAYAQGLEAGAATLADRVSRTGEQAQQDDTAARMLVQQWMDAQGRQSAGLEGREGAPTAADVTRAADAAGLELDDAVFAELLQQFEAEDPEGYQAWLSEGTEGDPTGAAGGQVPEGFEQMTPAQALQAAAFDALRRGFTDPLSGGFADATNLLTAAQNATLLEAGAVKLDDNTLITQEMLNHADPALRAQYQQAYGARQAAVENETRAALNQYALDEYTLQRQQAQDYDATAIAQHNAELATVRERLARDELNIEQAVSEAERILTGQQESRARADLVTNTQLSAAPYGTTGGKTEFTGADLGAGATATLRQLGHANPEQATAIKFPGVITLDPAGMMAAHDASLGVDRALPEIPAISLSDADIPRAPQLQGTGGVPLPNLQAPATAPAIELPPDLLAMLTSAARPNPDAELAQRRLFRGD